MIRRMLGAAVLALVITCSSPAFAADQGHSIVGVYARALQVVSKQLGVDAKKIDPNQRLRELGMDELDFVELIMALEEEFEIAIPDEAVDDNTVTTHRLAEVVVEQLRKKKR